MKPRRPYVPQPPSPLEAFQSEQAERLAAFKLDTVDLRPITRRADTCLTTVHVHMDWDERRKVKWLVFGEAHIQKFERKSQYLLKAYLPADVTDFEHDSAYAFRLPLVGLELDPLVLSYHQVSFVAIVDPNNPEDFRVPRPGYDPLKMEGTTTCTYHERCKAKPHLIVPEGFYAGPPFDRELYEMLRGKRVEIAVGPAPSKKELEEEEGE